MTTLKCKECDKDFNSIWRGPKEFCSVGCSRKHWNKNNRSKRRTTRDRWAINNPKKDLIASLKHRSQKKSLEFNLTAEDISDNPSVCPVLGIPILRFQGLNSHSSPSVDRMDNNKGYIKGNIRIISKRANSLKSNATLEELELILADARKLKWEQSMDPSTQPSGLL